MTLTSPDLRPPERRSAHPAAPPATAPTTQPAGPPPAPRRSSGRWFRSRSIGVAIPHGTDLEAEFTPPRLAGRFVRAGLLAVGLALGLGFSLPELPGLGHLQPAYPVPLSVAPPRVIPADPQVGLDRAAAVARAAAGHRCLPVAEWPQGRIPLGAVMTPPRADRAGRPLPAPASGPATAWYPFDRAWELARRGSAETVLLCSR